MGQNYLKCLFALGFQGFLDPDLRGDLRRADPERGDFRGCHQLHLEHCGLHRPALFQPVQDQLRDKICPRSALKEVLHLAAYISVPRDLTKVKSKVAFNLTKRQLVCFGTAALIGVPLFFVLRDSGGNTAATLGMMAVMLPAFFLGYVREKRSAHGKAAVVLCAGPVSRARRFAPTRPTTTMRLLMKGGVSP